MFLNKLTNWNLFKNILTSESFTSTFTFKFTEIIYVGKKIIINRNHLFVIVKRNELMKS